MQAIHSIKRDLILALCISALVFVCALAWGHPFFGPANNPATGPAAAASISAHPISAHRISAQQDHAPSVTVTGTVQQNGEQFFLRAVSGQVYRLDGPRHAQTYSGQ